MSFDRMVPESSIDTRDGPGSWDGLMGWAQGHGLNLFAPKIFSDSRRFLKGRRRGRWVEVLSLCVFVRHTSKEGLKIVHVILSEEVLAGVVVMIVVQVVGELVTGSGSRSSSGAGSGSGGGCGIGNSGGSGSGSNIGSTGSGGGGSSSSDCGGDSGSRSDGS
ncbi:uncharacterized protein LOC128555996 [Mercenaria mercenaria]|uniref:uncharacterized protein LOC128555996 n=1 Tax=Mercenaria mercenaria TaxID=6596 RepID=UPI00234FB226|nr:uncharacterized protein LOC128555996 [Mercenaria mercenaria]